MQKENSRYFDSKVFLRLFLSYVAVIIVFVVIYAVWFLSSYSHNHSEMMSQHYTQQAASWGTRMDQQLVTARAYCQSVNTSESCRELFQTMYMEKKTVNSMQLYRVLNDLKRIRQGANAMSVANIAVCFQGDNKIFTPGGVISFEGTPVVTMPEEAVISVGTLSEILGVTNHSQIIFNKRYLIYAEPYITQSGSMPKGLVIVLLEPSDLSALTEETLTQAGGAAITFRGEEVLSFGTASGRVFSQHSLLQEDIVYRLYAGEDSFRAPLSAAIVLPVVFIILLGVVFIVVTYFLSRRFYKPIGSIGEMIGFEGKTEDEISSIMDGIRSLISERNGYRERMITISPYVREGMVNMLLGSDVGSQRLSLLTDNEFLELRRPYYMVALANIASTVDRTGQHYRDVLSLIKQVCRDMTGDLHTVVCCAKNVQNIYIIIDSDEREDMESLVYTLHQKICEALDDEKYAVTIGVSAPQYDLADLQPACNQAQDALGMLLTGGRGSVYFDEQLHEKEHSAYFFPRDAMKHIARALKEGRREDLAAMLDEIERKNLQEADLPLGEIRLMLDELHITVSGALRQVYDRSTTHVQLQRPQENMTAGEIFAYYRTVLETAVSGLPEAGDDRAQGQLEEDVVSYIDQNYCDPDLSLASLCDHFGVSAKVVGLICKKKLGTTFLQYVHEKQIHRAAELLKNSDESLEEIAKQCGFVNVLTFRRNFKAVMDMNPSDFRG